MKALIIAEYQQGKLKLNTLSVMTAAKELNAQIDVLVIGYQLEAITKIVASIEGVNTVLVADNKIYQDQLAENMSELIAQLAKDYHYILVSASTFGKDVLPRVAGLIEVEQISDITKIINANTFERPIYAGNAFQTVETAEQTILLTVRASSFPKASIGDQVIASIVKLDSAIPATHTQLIQREAVINERPDLSTARVVISGGRGLQNAENFKLLESLAAKLNAAIGASRAAVDAGFVPNDYQVGQTGKIVAPELYIAVGISGAIQHLAGMKDSKVIVAINKDPEAPIFKIADYGLVGDLFEIIPALEKALS